MVQQTLPTEILQWLFRVLQPVSATYRETLLRQAEQLLTMTKEYVNPNAGYHDIAATLQAYPTLKPRTRVYTTDSGQALLLLNLYGSLPATIHGRVYKIPVELWIPHEYPLVSPIAYVVPTEKMVLQPGNHVDTSGKCYLPYLASWGQYEQPSNIFTLCGELSAVFSKESPVFAKPSTPSRVVSTPMSSLQAQASGSTPTPPPALPPKSQPETPGVISPVLGLPPKDPSVSSANGNAASPPPLPPLPEELRSRMVQSPTLNRMNEQSQRDVRPVFEQPNIMDRLTDTITNQDKLNTDRERESGMERVQSMLQNIYESDISVSLSKFNADVNQIKYAVGKFDKIFEYEFEGLEKVNVQISENEKALTQAIQAAQETISQADNFKEINTDEVICGETVVFNQLYDLVAEDQAISDTIYALTKAHDHGLIALTSFIKHTRNLARDQFMKKALIVKITTQLGLQQ